MLSVPKSGTGPTTPTVLASGVISPSGIAVDNTYVYFGEGSAGTSTIRKVPKAGGTVTTIVAGLNSVYRLTLDANNIYWTDIAGGLIQSIPKTGGSPTTLATDPSAPGGIAVDSQNVYWTEMVVPGNVVAAPIGGGPVTYLGLAVNTPGLATDGTFVYWTESAYAVGQVNSNYIGKGSIPSTLASGLFAPYDLVMDSTSVYWVDSYPGDVKQISIAGGTPSVLASGLSEPIAITADSANVYWIENDYGVTNGGVLRSAPKQSSPPFVRLTVQTSSTGIVYSVDGNQYEDSPQVFNWIPGSSHTLEASPTQAIVSGEGRYSFNNWSDAGAATHSVAPNGNVTYTATYDTQFGLALTSNGNGTVSPPSALYTAGQTVAISATPNTGYTFVGWSGNGAGSYTGSSSSASVTMNAPIVEAALFSQCAYALGSSAQTFLSATASSSVPVTALPGCPWQAASNAAWISVTLGGTGNGNGTVTYSIAANSTGSSRTGTMTIAGLTFQVTQSATAVCSYSASLPSPSFSATGGAGTASVTAPVGCSWTAATTLSWVTIQSGAAGTGSGALSLVVASNSSSGSRSGTLTVAGQSFTITQMGAGSLGVVSFGPFMNLSNFLGSYNVALGADGSLFVAIVGSTGGIQLFKSTDGGSTFGSPVLVTSNAVLRGSFDMAIDSSNAVHIAWEGNGVGNISQIFYSRSTDGGASFSTPITPGTGGGSNPKIASDGAGNVYIAYSGVWIYRSTNSGASFQPEYSVKTPDGAQYEALRVRARQGVYAVLLVDETNHDTYFHHGTSTAILNNAVRINQTLHKGGSGPGSGDFVLDPNGTAVYSLYQDTGTNPNGDISFTRSTDGGTTWGSYTRVNDTTTQQTSNPVVALDGGGGLHVVWVDNRTGWFQAFYSYSDTVNVSFSPNTSLSPGQPSALISGPLLLLDQAHAILYVAAQQYEVSGFQLALATSLSSTPVAPALALGKSHSGNFTQGETGATYIVAVSNGASAGPTSGTVTVTENVPTGLSLTSMSGQGWTCSANTCTRSDILNGGASYPSITVTAAVASNAPSQVTNSATVSGGGSPSASANDVTAITAPSAILTVNKTHTGTFVQGQSGAVYTVAVQNSVMAGPTSGAVTVTESLPTGLSLVSMFGTGWTCSGNTCARNDALNAGANYPMIAVTVNVAANAPSQVTNSVTASGGGSAATTASDVTNVVPASGLSLNKSHSGNFMQGQTGATYTLVVMNSASAGTTNGTVAVTENLPSGLTLVSMTGTGWTCSSNTCSRSDALAANSSYPAITVTANVAANASSPLINSATVSGGGSASATANDSTAIIQPSSILTPAAAVGSPTMIVRVPLNLTVPSGIVIDALTFGVLVTPGTGTPSLLSAIGFSADSSLSLSQTVTAGNTMNQAGMFIQDQGTPLAGTLHLGDLLITVPAAATPGQTYIVSVNNSSAAISSVNVPLTSGGNATLTVANTYLVGDVFPYSADTVGSFGDGLLNTLDLIAALRAVTALPGFVPAKCSDRFDAMDSFPVDTANQRGGDGLLNTLDLIETLRRVTNLDTNRPTRAARGLSCTSSAPSATPDAVRGPAVGSIWFGSAQPGQGGAARVPVYLHAGTDAGNGVNLAGLSLSVASEGSGVALQFIPVEVGPPSVTDNGLPGVMAVAWLKGLRIPAGDVLIGYVQASGVDAAASFPLVFYGVDANMLADGRSVRFETKGRP